MDVCYDPVMKELDRLIRLSCKTYDEENELWRQFRNGQSSMKQR